MIEAENITKNFGSVSALRNVSFKIEEGEIVGFLGPNGAGKTTTMRILSCFLPPTSGTARISGLDVTRNSMEVRRKIGYSLEGTSLYPDMRVLPFLQFVGKLKGVNKKELKHSISEVIELCGLDKVDNRIIANLSKGYRQRLCLAQAMINRPEVLILDEPTIGLDPENVSEMRNLIKGLSGNRTVIVSSHILSEISMVCSKVIIMDKGKIIAEGTPDGLSHQFQPQSMTDIEIEGDNETILARLKEVPGVKQVEIKGNISEKIYRYKVESEKGKDIMASLNNLAHENHWIIRGIQPDKMSLEDIFLKIVMSMRNNDDRRAI